MTTAPTSLSACTRCKRLYSEMLSNAAMWNVNFFQGYPVGLLCPSCQTPDEFLEAETNTANLEGTELVTLSSVDPVKRAEMVVEMIYKSAQSVIKTHREKAERTGETHVRVNVETWATEATAGVLVIQGQPESVRASARGIAMDYINGALGLSKHAAKV
ncbi:hypothetical protein [Brachybacterium sp. NPDC056505]|uniref:hypothetical protein n=1 Tax=Brachybacterium sp. NPDC056505 TaxID=3345843 RepID=UPI00366C577E